MGGLRVTKICPLVGVFPRPRDVLQVHVAGSTTVAGSLQAVTVRGRKKIVTPPGRAILSRSTWFDGTKLVSFMVGVPLFAFWQRYTV